MIARSLFRILSPAGARARLSVLIFHRVRERSDPLFPGEPDLRQFERQMGWLAHWFNVLSLPEAVQRLRAGNLPARAAAITFDDGYADNFCIALPILRRLGLPATFFVSTGFLDGGRMWNDTIIEAVRRSVAPAMDLPGLGLRKLRVDTPEAKRAAIALLLSRLKYVPSDERNTHAACVAEASQADLPSDLMLTSSQIRAIGAAGMTLGAHTVSHPILARLAEDEAKMEIAASKARLETLTNQRVVLFAYPNGKPGVDYGAREVRLVRECGFAAAFSSRKGVSTCASDPFQLPRFTPWDRTPARWAYRLADNLRSGQRNAAMA